MDVSNKIVTVDRLKTYNNKIQESIENSHNEILESIEEMSSSNDEKFSFANNLQNGEGVDSLIQNVTTIDPTDPNDFENTATVDSAVTFGKSNINRGKRSVITGKLNDNAGANSFLTGYNNKNSAVDVIVAGSQNNNLGNNSVVSGINNTNNAGTSFVTGTHNINSQNDAIVGGRWNDPNGRALFSIGNGSSDEDRKNAFEVLRDGRAKVQSAPIDDNDIVRYQDTTTNLINGDAIDSIAQKYTGNVDETHFSNVNTGESSVVFGESNDNTANRALMWGKLNKNSGQNIVGGLRNNVAGSQNIVAGQQNGGIGSTYDEPTLTATTPVNAMGSLIVGGKNKVGGVQKVEYSLIAGAENDVNNSSYAIIAGHSNNMTSTNNFIVGGSANSISTSNSSIVVGDNNNVTDSPRSVITGSNNTSTHLENDTDYPCDSIMVGQNNENHKSNSIIGGLKVHNFAQSSLLIGEDNYNYSYGTIIAGENNKSGSETSGIYAKDNIVGGQHNVANRSNSLIVGQNNKSNNGDSIIGGHHNIGREDTLLEIGNGTKSEPRNAFEVYEDGSVRAYKKPVVNEDIVRKIDLDDKIALILDDKGLTDTIDSFRELQELLGTDKTGSTGLLNQVAKNTSDISKNADTINNFNLTNGSGTDSLIQKVSTIGPNDENDFENTAIVDSAVTFGKSNANGGKRSFVTGKLNVNTGANTIVGGLRNTVNSNHSIVTGEGNNIAGARSIVNGIGNQSSQGGHTSIIVADNGENNGAMSILVGEDLKNQATHSALFGYGLENSSQNKVVLGKFNQNKEDTLLEIGNGTTKSDRKNAFEVLRDGRAKLQTAPVENNDVVRYQDVTTNFINGEGNFSINQKLINESTSAKATGYGAIAFGGYRGDKFSETPQSLPTLKTDDGSIDDTITLAAGIQSIAVMAGNRAWGNWTFVGGKDNVAFQQNSITFGGSNRTGLTAQEWINKYGSLEAKASDYSNRDFHSAYSFGATFGNDNINKGQSNLVSGGSNTVEGSRNLIAGYDNDLTGSYGLQFGASNTVVGDYNIVGGLNSNVNGGKNLIVGKSHIVDGEANIVSGVNNKVNGYQSVAIGNEAFIGYDRDGTKRNSMATASVALGWSRANANYTLTAGYDTEAKNSFSVALNNHTITGAPSQTVIGEYNIGKDNTSFEIGGGTAETRKNVFEVYKNGIVKIYSDNLPTADEDVIYKKYLDSVIDSTVKSQDGKLDSKYTELSNKLSSEYAQLSSKYDELLGKYEELLNRHEELSGNHDKLQESLDELSIKFTALDEKVNNTECDDGIIVE